MGASVNKIGGSLYYGIFKIFQAIFLPMLKVSFYFKFERLKILKDIFEQDYPIMATEIRYNFISLSILNLSYA